MILEEGVCFYVRIIWKSRLDIYLFFFGYYYLVKNLDYNEVRIFLIFFNFRIVNLVGYGKESDFEDCFFFVSKIILLVFLEMVVIVC